MHLQINPHCQGVIMLTDTTSAQNALTQAQAGITTTGFTFISRSLDDQNTQYAIRITHTCGWFYETNDPSHLPTLISACNDHRGCPS